MFKCPNCKGTQLEEIMSGVTLATQLQINKDGDIAHGCMSANDSGEVERYQCTTCGWKVRDKTNKLITDLEDLVKFLFPYVVMSTDNKTLFWSNEHGWTEIESASRFSEEEHNTLFLPMGGEWHYDPA